MKAITFGTALIFSLILPSLSHSAPTLTYVSQVVDPSGSQAPGTEYDLFGTGVSSLPDFSVSQAPSGANLSLGAQSAYATVIVPGGATPTGTGLFYNIDTDSQQEIFTFTLTSSTPSDFSFYLLDDNGNNNGIGNTALAVSVDGGTQVPHSTDTQGVKDEFTEFSVTGATSSDTFTVYATSSQAPSFGGITFTSPTATVPEPSTNALLCAGLGLMALAYRRWVLRRRSLASSI